jgi:hypothetical protein
MSMLTGGRGLSAGGAEDRSTADDLAMDADVASLADAADIVDFPVVGLEHFPACSEVGVHLGPLLSGEYDPDLYLVAELDCPSGSVLVQQAPAGVPISASMSQYAAEGGLAHVEVNVGPTALILTADWEAADLVALADALAAVAVRR